MRYRWSYHSQSSPKRAEERHSRRLKKMTVIALVSVPAGLMIIMFLSFYARSSWAAGRRLACWSLLLALPAWALGSSALNLASVSRERNMKKLTLIGIACFPVGIALLWLVAALGIWRGASSGLGASLILAIALFAIAAPILILVSFLREPSRKVELIILGNIILWVMCAIALLNLLWGPGYRF